MRFFLEFLNNFTARQIVHMFAAGVFKTSDEIKMADYTINFKVIFDDEKIPSEDLKVYYHLQRLVDAIRVHCRYYRKNLDETFRDYSTEEVRFNHFIRYGENEREVAKLNIVERRMIFAFKGKGEQMMSLFDWLKGALQELLNYVLREFAEADRVGIVIKHENQQNRKATFPIMPRNLLETAFMTDTLNSIMRMDVDTFIAEERLTMQVLRIRMPVAYRKLELDDRPKVVAKDLYDCIEEMEIDEWKSVI